MGILVFITVCLTVAGITYYDKWATMLDKWEKPIFWQPRPAMFGYVIFRWLLYFCMYYMAYKLMGWTGMGISMICQFYLGRILLKRFYRKRLLAWLHIYTDTSLKNNEDLSDPEVQQRNMELANESARNAMLNRNAYEAAFETWK